MRVLSPLEFMTLMRLAVPCRELKTICLPEGDQEGYSLSALSNVS
jgi:hypothetical protein